MKHELIELLRRAGNLGVDFLVKYSFQVIGGIVILLVGMKLSQWLSLLFVRFCEKRKMDVTTTKFLAGGLRVVVMVFVVMIALEKFGVTIAPFIAAGSALVFGGSFAIQGPLSNYEAGLSIILGKSFVVGDTISVIGVSGVVEEVKLPSTILVTADGERITIPNKHIVGEVIHNSKGNKVVEGTVGISYSADPDKAISAVREVLRRFPQVAESPAPQVGIREFGDSSVNLSLRYWVPTHQYYQTLFDINLAVYKALQQAGIPIPFPQRDVRIVSQAK